MILSVRLDVWLVGHELANGKQFAALTYIWLKPPVYRHLFLTSSLWLVWNYVKLMLGLFDVPFSHDKSCDGTDFSTFYNNPSMIIPAIWWYYSNPYCYTSQDHPTHCNSTFPIHPGCHQEGLAVQPPDVSLAGTTRATWLFFFGIDVAMTSKSGIMW